MRNIVRGLASLLLVSVCCRADLTLRYTIDVKAIGAPSGLPKELATKVRDGKTLTKLGNLTAIIGDNSSLTLLNPAAKQYAQVSMADYFDGLRAGFPAAPVMKNLKFDVETSKTGNFEMISGIRAEDQLTKMTVSREVPGVPVSPVFRVEMHTWLASPDDLNGFPALRQYAASAQRAMNVSTAGDELERLFRQMPGAAENLRAVTEAAARSAGSLTLKLQGAYYSLNRDPNVPVSAITIELAEISSNAIDDAIFEVPPDFQIATVAELLKAAIPVPPPGPRQSPPGQAPRGVPMVIYKVDPVYTEEARRAKLEGAVMLKIVVGADGVAKNIQVAKSLGLGLDEKAIEAVSQWKFRPAEKNGLPVDMPATIVMNFRLLDRPPQQ